MKVFASPPLVFLFCIALPCSLSSTDPNDLAVLQEFYKGLDNPAKLSWPSAGIGDACGPPAWKHVFCSGDRVTQIQVQNVGLSGVLPSSLNNLSKLSNLGLQKNYFRGALPSFNGLSNLQYAYLDSNLFDTIPDDFFVGLTDLQVISLDDNPLNLTSGGWTLPSDLAGSPQLRNLSLVNTSLIGQIPDFLGNLSSLTVLKLSYNNLTGPIPNSLSNSVLQILWLNNQNGPGLSGSMDVLGSMNLLTDVWLHGNQFSGQIPESIGSCTALWRIWLNGNQFVGLVPVNLTSLPALQSLKLDNNMLMGPVPDVPPGVNFTYSGNTFCNSNPGKLCLPEITALLDFLNGVNFPLKLAASWSGNDPCTGDWLGVSCTVNNNVSIVNLPKFGMNGTISPSLGKLSSLSQIILRENNLTGTIPENLTSLSSLKLLDVSGNNLSPPLPQFADSVKVITSGNPLLAGSPAPAPSNLPVSPSGNSPGSGNNGNNNSNTTKGSKNLSTIFITVATIMGALLVIFVALFLFLRCKQARERGKNGLGSTLSIMVDPKVQPDPQNGGKSVISDHDMTKRNSSAGQSEPLSNSGSILGDGGNYIISVHLLRFATRNFAKENVVGRGGFGVVYRGELHDGTAIAVKRMEAAVVSTKANDEFLAEIALLTKVRHRNLVSILGYSMEGTERLLVYEYMPQGALSEHLFHWREFELEPLSWEQRVNIALDVARGMEYLHNLGHHCFIHRDLKSSNILLGDDFRAKVSDFGLVKLAPDGKNSVATRLAGTFGYLAPEYAVTGKITTKADVFSFGVVLMELITGLTALDETRPEETRYLASYFSSQVKNDKDVLLSAMDKSLDLNKETIESISRVAELAGHCAAQDPQQRPGMGHAVNVLAQLADTWRPVSEESDDSMGIDYGKPLIQMVKRWQADDSILGSTSNSVSVGLSSGASSSSIGDSKGSIPARPFGFAESFTSADGR